MQKVRREKNLICEPIEILLRSLEDLQKLSGSESLSNRQTIQCFYFVHINPTNVIPFPLERKVPFNLNILLN
jgi:hypothetical protein